MRPSGLGSGHAALTTWCAAVVLLAGTFAFATLSAILDIPCDRSPDLQRFCAWWGHSALPTQLGMPAVLAFGCYASASAGSRRPVTIAGVLVAITCLGLRQAAGLHLY
jgi:hypothetical protein